MSSKSNFGEVLKNVSYRRLLLSTVISRFGDAVDMIAYSYMVIELTGSAVLMATIFAVNGIPALLLNMVSGVLVTYWPKKRVVVLCEMGRGLVVTLTAFLYLTGMLQVWHLYLFTIISSSFEAFSSPASSALMVLVITKDEMDHAVSLTTSLRTMAELVGYSVAALLIGVIGVSGAIFVDGATFMISALLILMIHGKHEVLMRETLTFKRYFKDLKDGLAYATSHPLVRTMVFFAGGIGFFLAPFNALQMPFILDVMALGELGISVMSVAFMVSMIGGSLLVPRISDKIGYKNLFVVGGLVIGIGYILFGYAPIMARWMNPYLALIIGSVIMGSTITFMNVPIRVALMKKVDEKMIPRMIALINVFGLASVPIGGALSGALVTMMDMTQLFFVSGVMVCVIFLYQHFNQDLKHLDDHSPMVVQ